MENIILSVDCLDSEYEDALAKAIQRNSRGITVKKKDKNGDIIMTDDFQKAGPSVFVLREKSFFEGNDITARSLYKYDNVRSMLKTVKGEYIKSNDIFMYPCDSADTAIVTFFSKTGGTGTTSVAMAYAQEMRRYYNRKTLYISLDFFDGADQYMKRREGGNIRHFLYYLQERREKECRAMDAFLMTDEYRICAFSTYKGINPINTITEDKYQGFLEFVITHGDFDLIVVDGGSLPSEKLFTTIRRAKKNFEVENYEPDSDLCKGDSREEYYIRRLGKALYDDTVLVRNKYIPSEKVQDEKNLQGYQVGRKEVFLNFDSSSFFYEDGIKKISLDKAFGMSVKELVKM